MAAENTTIQPNFHSSSSGPLRLVNGPDAVMAPINAGGANDAFSDAMAPGDRRWLFAARVQAVLQSGIALAPEDNWQAVVEAGEQMGLNVFQCRSIVHIVEDAQSRGGLDTIAMRELLSVPEPDADDDDELPARVRWTVFGVLFCWALLVAGLMQVVA